MEEEKGKKWLNHNMKEVLQGYLIVILDRLIKRKFYIEFNLKI